MLNFLKFGRKNLNRFLGLWKIGNFRGGSINLYEGIMMLGLGIVIFGVFIVVGIIWLEVSVFIVNGDILMLIIGIV